MALKSRRTANVWPGYPAERLWGIVRHFAFATNEPINKAKGHEGRSIVAAVVRIHHDRLKATSRAPEYCRIRCWQRGETLVLG